MIEKTKIPKFRSPRIRQIPDYGSHACEQLAEENRKRTAEANLPIYMFKDLEDKRWHMKVGIEFVFMNFCPFCGRSL